MPIIERVEALDLPMQTALQAEIAAMLPVVLAAQRLTARWIRACPIDCRCSACELEEALADYYARGGH